MYTFYIALYSQDPRLCALWVLLSPSLFHDCGKSCYRNPNEPEHCTVAPKWCICGEITIKYTINLSVYPRPKVHLLELTNSTIITFVKNAKYSGSRVLRTPRAGNICPYYPAVPNKRRGPKAHESHCKKSRNMKVGVFIATTRTYCYKIRRRSKEG